MPKQEPDATDPMELTGVEVPSAREDVEAMALAFAEEFAATGWDENRLARLFASPFYAGPHLAWRTLGEERCRALIAQAVQPWRKRHA